MNLERKPAENVLEFCIVKNIYILFSVPMECFTCFSVGLSGKKVSPRVAFLMFFSHPGSLYHHCPNDSNHEDVSNLSIYIFMIIIAIPRLVISSIIIIGE